MLSFPGMGAWEHFPHEADIGLRGRDATLAGAFEQTALAMTAAITDPALVEAREKVEITCAEADRELLLIDWLNALIYEMAVRKMLFSRFQVEIRGDVLRAGAWGEKVDPARHDPSAEIKGATYTALEIRREENGDWTTRCVVDV